MISDAYRELESSSSGARLPSLTALRCFAAAAREEHFARAAEALHVTPGAISRAVRLLEAELEVTLFERRRQRVFLTDEGRQLARAVEEGLAVMAQAVAELRARARRGRQLVISCEPTLLMRWLIPRWSEFQARHPQLPMHLVAGGGGFSFEQGIDLAIRRDDFPCPAHYHREPLFEEQVAAVCRTDRVEQWFTAEGQLRPSAPLLHTRTRPTAWSAWAQAAGQSVKAQGGQVFEHFYFSLQAAVAGLGVAIGPWHLVQDDIRSGVLAAPSGFFGDGSRYCLYLPAAPAEDSLASELLAWLRAVG
ncbi:LysR family transcriptional regulator [Ectopseudomonas khazarica]|uniref:LysR family transcriptional regulator n=1 Tax=Ectopseudomonas khazarica TaxID=2502979 RepID=UPI0005607223